MIQAEFLPRTDPTWVEWIKTDPNATVFHHPAWLNILRCCYNQETTIFSIKDRGELLAGIPITNVKMPFSPHRWVALPFSDYCTPLGQSSEYQNELLSQLVEQAKINSIRKVEIRCAVENPRFAIENDVYVKHDIFLEPCQANVVKRIHRQQMQNVRTAEKNHISIKQGIDKQAIEEFYRLHTLTRRKHGTPVQPRKFFTRVEQDLLANGLGFILLAYLENRCVSAGVFFHWNQTLTFKYSATDDAYQNLRPNHLVTWTAIQWGCEHGCQDFDFGRSQVGDLGLRAYKNRWGAEEKPLVYSYIPEIPGFSSGRTGKLGDVLNLILTRCPVWVTRAAGELLYRYFC